MKITKKQLNRMIREEVNGYIDPETGISKHALEHARNLAPKIVDMIYNQFMIDDPPAGEEVLFTEALRQLVTDWYTGNASWSVGSYQRSQNK